MASLIKEAVEISDFSDGEVDPTPCREQTKHDSLVKGPRIANSTTNHNPVGLAAHRGTWKPLGGVKTPPGEKLVAIEKLDESGHTAHLPLDLFLEISVGGNAATNDANSWHHLLRQDSPRDFSGEFDSSSSSHRLAEDF